MEFMNAFVSREFDNMRTFLQNISVKHLACNIDYILADTPEVYANSSSSRSSVAQWSDH